jgi:hypothetical protein
MFDKIIKSGKRGSNPRPSAWEADALPAELLPLIYRIIFVFSAGANPSGRPLAEMIHWIISYELSLKLEFIKHSVLS